MFPTTLQSHLHAHSLPLRWLRVPLLLATLGLSAVCVAVSAQAIRGTIRLEKSLKAQAIQEGIEIDFDMQDVRAVTDVLTAVAILLAITSLACLTVLCSDWIGALMRTRTGHATIPPKSPLSTRSLRLQAVTLSFVTLWLFATLIPTTFFVRTRSANVTTANIEGGSVMSFPVTRTDPLYWDYGFLRCLAAAPWFSFIAAFPTTILTISAASLAKISHFSGEDKGDIEKPT